MYSDPTNFDSTRISVENAKNAFLASESPLIAVLNGDPKVDRASLESLTLPNNPLYVFGRLPGFSDLQTHRDGVNSDLHFFVEACQIVPEANDVAACLWYRLKTGESLAEHTIDIITRNRANDEKDWFRKHSSAVYPTKAICCSILGLPGFGKSFLLSQLSEAFSFLPFDSDTFRYYTLAHKLLPADQELFDDSPRGRWLLSQQAYTPLANQVFRLLNRAVARSLIILGNSVVSSGLPLAAEADVIFWVNGDEEELALDNLLQMTIPDYETLRGVNESSSCTEEFMQSAFHQWPDLEKVYQIVSEKVAKRVNYNNGDLGSFNWSNPDYQPILRLQKIGANPRMNECDIIFTIAWIIQSVRELREESPIIIPITPGDGISPERLRKFMKPRHSETLIEIDADRGNVIPPLLPHDVVLPAELFEARLSAIDQARIVFDGLPNKVITQIAKLENPDGPKRSKALADIIQEKCAQVIRGLIYGNPPEGSAQEIVFESGERDKGLVRLAATILKVDLRAAPTGAVPFYWPSRWEDGASLPSPVHSMIVLPMLGRTLSPELCTIADLVADFSHDVVEEAVNHPEVDGKLQEGVHYSQDRSMLNNLLQEIRSIPDYGAFASYIASVLTEAMPKDETRAMYNKVRRLFGPAQRAAHDHAIAQGLFLDEEVYERVFFHGPVSFGLLALKEQLAPLRLFDAYRSREYPVTRDHVIATFRTAFKDRLDDIFSLTRYLDPSFNDQTKGFDDQTKAEARAKIIITVARLFNIYDKLMRGFDELPRDLQESLKYYARMIIPTLHWSIDHLVNPRLQELGEKPISDEELYRFYWDYHQPLMMRLDPVLKPMAEKMINDAFNFSYER